MVEQKTLSAFRVDIKTFNHINKAIEKYNKDPSHLAKLSKNAFRRLALELLAQSILQDVKLQVQLNVSNDL